MANKACVITGTPVEGFEVHGPFSDGDMAHAWALSYRMGFWWVAQLQPPCNVLPAVVGQYTVQQLREALADLPDDMPVQLWIAGDEIGGDLRSVHDERANDTHRCTLSSGE